MNINGYWRGCRTVACTNPATRAVTQRTVRREPTKGDRLLWVCVQHAGRTP